MINNLLFWLWNTENIAIILSLLSITITIYTTLQKKLSERMNLSIEPYLFEVPHQRKLIILDLGFINNSSRPFSISRLSLEVSEPSDPTKKATGTCFGTNQIIKEIKVTNKHLERIKDVIRSSTLPLHLLSFGSSRGKFVFEFQDISTSAMPHKKCVVVVQTTTRVLRIPINLAKVLEEQEKLRLR